MRSTPEFAIVIPVYNHAQTVKSVVERARTLGPPVYAVDDGSTDGTAGILGSLQGITVLNHPVNQGKGAALLTGFAAAAAAQADFVITMDADGQHDPSDAVSLMNAVSSEAPVIVVGKREGMLNDSSIQWTSRFGRKFSNFWVRLSGGPVLSDSQSGFRIYPVREILALRSRARRFQFEVEILVLAQWHGIRIDEMPVSVLYQPRGERISHFRPFVDFWRNAGTFSRLIALRLLVPRSWRRRMTQR